MLTDNNLPKKTKSQLRQEIKSKMQTLDQVWKSDFEKKINATIYHFIKQRSICIGVYLAQKDEVSIDRVISSLLKLPKVIIAAPTIFNQELIYRQLTSLGQLDLGPFGIRQPDLNGRIIKPNQMDIIFVPGIAFDRQGFRLGRGKGYFDRFLSEFKGRSIGICFDFQLLKTIRHEPHDIPVNFVMTDCGIWDICEQKYLTI